MISKLAAIKFAVEKLRGGPGDNKPDSDFQAMALAAGTKEEAEHTDDPAVAKEIAKDHLVENPGEYSKKASAICSACGHPFDAANQPETSMGSVQCPKCAGTTDQEGNMLKKRASIFNKVASAYVDDISFIRLPDDTRTDVARFVPHAKNTTLFPRYGTVVKELIGKCDPENLKSARKTVREESPKKVEKEFYDKLKSKYVLLVNDRVVDGHHFIAKGESCGCTCSLNVLDLTPARFAKKAEGDEGEQKLSTWAKLAEAAQTPDKLRALMDLALTHNVGSAVMGAGAGATIGALSPIDKKKKNAPSRLQRILNSALIGGGTGLAASFVAPQLSSKLNHAVADQAILKPVGRVVTNLSTPEGYDDKASEIVKNIRQSPWQSIKAVVEDKPLWFSGETPASSYAVLRDMPFRKLYGLPYRGIGPNYPLKEDGTYAVNNVVERDLKDGLMNILRPGEHLPPEPGMEGLQPAIPVTLPQAADGSGRVLIKNNLLGNVTMTPIVKNKSYSFRDRWDVTLGKDDKIDSVSNALRHILSKLNHPVTFTGNVELPEKQTAMSGGLEPLPMQSLGGGPVASSPASRPPIFGKAPLPLSL